VSEQARPEFLEAEESMHDDQRTELARAKAFGQELMRARFAEETRRIPPRDSDELARVVKDLAVLMLAKISVPGDVELHEAVFRAARQMIGEA
jgi:hypothetical protein